MLSLSTSGWGMGSLLLLSIGGYSVVDLVRIISQNLLAAVAVLCDNDRLQKSNMADSGKSAMNVDTLW